MALSAAFGTEASAQPTATMPASPPGLVSKPQRAGLDVMLVIGRGGNMYLVLEDAMKKLIDLVSAIDRLTPSARVGAVTYGTMSDPIQAQELTASTEPVVVFLEGIQPDRANGRQNILAGLKTAIEGAHWAPQSRKVIILVTDSAPDAAEIPRALELARRFASGNGWLSAIDVSGDLLWRAKEAGKPPPVSATSASETSEFFKALTAAGRGATKSLPRPLMPSASATPMIIAPR